MFSTRLNLNKKRIRNSVISKLKELGYSISDNACHHEIITVVKKVQMENGLIVDGYIGEKTMRALGYSGAEICKMLKSARIYNTSTYQTPIWIYPFWF